jgi:flagellar motor switch protein FliN/FliY
MKLSELTKLTRGSIFALDRRIGEHLDIVLNGKVLGRGEIVVMENDPNRLGFFLTEIVSQ